MWDFASRIKTSNQASDRNFEVSIRLINGCIAHLMRAKVCIDPVPTASLVCADIFGELSAFLLERRSASMSKCSQWPRLNREDPTSSVS
jgi:hypothetical protein